MLEPMWNNLVLLDLVHCLYTTLVTNYGSIKCITWRTCNARCLMWPCCKDPGDTQCSSRKELWMVSMDEEIAVHMQIHFKVPIPLVLHLLIPIVFTDDCWMGKAYVNCSKKAVPWMKVDLSNGCASLLMLAPFWSKIESLPWSIEC